MRSGRAGSTRSKEAVGLEAAGPDAVGEGGTVRKKEREIEQSHTSKSETSMTSS